ncbi:hypothetical protein ICHIJ1_07770 [Fluviibacter phosphoraccumulans]|uniref:type II toxin-antitoxin system RelE/ParE family toxin n=1 Tax=Fluviibacter phosphoraccumulans TaxID=1751046 RepID=UPI001366CB72|nr:type II toxin-antitoxin system RelE/ParE family toxin [Fluviibacter phosphoraccumulans]BBU70858.1 hypothetical protein ICHIJ1_07770 [Fluviibacter phosphoraccumulans]
MNEIESHATTIDVLKWVIVGLLAWVLGVFRFIRTNLKRPKLEIESFTSRCIWQELGIVDGNDHNARVVFLIEAGINNPTTDPIEAGRVVPEFNLDNIRELIHAPFRVVYLRQATETVLIRIWRSERQLELPENEE